MNFFINLFGKLGLNPHLSSFVYNLMNSRCNLQANCSISVSDEQFGEDPCPGTLKYVEVHYECVGQSPPPQFGSLLDFEPVLVQKAKHFCKFRAPARTGAEIGARCSRPLRELKNSESSVERERSCLASCCCCGEESVRLRLPASTFFFFRSKLKPLARRCCRFSQPTRSESSSVHFLYTRGTQNRMRVRRAEARNGSCVDAKLKL